MIAWKQMFSLMAFALVMFPFGSGVHAQNANSRGEGLALNFMMPSEPGASSFEIWANQRSNALSSGFLFSAQQGGFLTRSFLQGMIDAHPLLGGMGGQIGWSKRFTSRPLKDGPWALTGAFGSEVFASVLWRRELLELALIGNANHTGRVDVFNGTGMRLGAFNRISIGMEHKDTRQRIELSIVQRLAGFEWGIPNGSFWVSENVDSMEVNMQAYGAASLDKFPGEGGVAVNRLLPSYGLGISGALPLTSELFPLQFLVDFQDVGVMWERSGGLVASLDTGFATTGLAVPFSQYFTEGSVNSDALTWQDVVDGTSGIQPDSLYFTSDSAHGRMLMLPTKVQASLTWWPTPDVQLKASARAGAWMPEPELTVGLGWIPGNRFSFGIDYRTGGWGGGRPVTWLECRITRKRILSIEIEDPAGWIWGSEAASNTYGRGVRFSLRRIPGEGWTRFMGLPARSLSYPDLPSPERLPKTSSQP